MTEEQKNAKSLLDEICNCANDYEKSYITLEQWETEVGKWEPIDGFYITSDGFIELR